MDWQCSLDVSRSLSFHSSQPPPAFFSRFLCLSMSWRVAALRIRLTFYYFVRLHLCLHFNEIWIFFIVSVSFVPKSLYARPCYVLVYAADITTMFMIVFLVFVTEMFDLCLIFEHDFCYRCKIFWQAKIHRESGLEEYENRTAGECMKRKRA